MTLPAVVLTASGVDSLYSDIVSRFDLIVSRHAHEVALRFGSTCMDYRTLDALSDRVAGYLAKRGVAAGECVGLAGPFRLHTAVALLGILKAGAHYVYLDDALPERSLRQIKSRLNIRQALSSSGRAMPLEALCLPYTAVAELSPEGPGRPAVVFDADTIAYVNFSSGSTGQPKAIACCHRGVTRLCVDQPILTLGTSTVMLVNSPLTFDLSVLEIWGPLLNGGQCVFHDEALLTPAGLRGLITRQRVNTLWLTSAFFNTIVDLDASCMEGARAVFAGGDVLSVEHMRRAMQANPQVSFINGYGPTENTTFTTCHNITVADLRRSSLPIGRPINGTGVVICDEYLTPLPAGQLGELVTFGAGLAHGYLGDLELQKAKFCQMELDGVLRQVYLTGDLARLGEDGLLEFHGRKDKEVKINGFRIDLAELEEYFRNAALVRDCALLAVDRQGIKQLLAAIVPARGAHEEALDAVERQMVTQLPPYSRPHAVFTVAQLPLTATGKLDRSALLERWQGGAIELAGLSMLERECATLWQRHLGRLPPSRRSDFFLTGGNSLLALRLLADAGRALALDGPLPLTGFYSASRFGDFCDWLAVQAGRLTFAANADSALLKVRPTEEHEPIPAATLEAELTRRFPVDSGVQLFQYRGDLLLAGETASLDDEQRSWLTRHRVQIAGALAERQLVVELNPYQRSIALDELFNGNLSSHSLFFQLLPTCPWTDEQLWHAAAAVYRRYPLLNAGVCQNGERFLFLLDERLPPPNLVFDDEEHPSNEDFCRHYLHLRHSLFKHGYLRLVRSKAAGTPVYGLWLHHIAVDAQFIERLLPELRAELEGEDLGGEPDFTFIQQNWHIARQLEQERAAAHRHWALLRSKFAAIAPDAPHWGGGDPRLIEQGCGCDPHGGLLQWAIARKTGLLAVFAILLHNACGCVLGWRPLLALTTCTQRNNGISPDGSGCYTNLLPLLLEQAELDTNVESAIEIVSQVVRDAMAASILPYEEISEACGGLRGKEHVLINIFEERSEHAHDWAVSCNQAKVRRPMTLTVFLQGGRLERLALAGQLELVQLESLLHNIQQAISGLVEKDTPDAVHDLATA